jgi:hypothetical protein
MRIGTKVQLLPIEENLVGEIIDVTLVNGTVEYTVAVEDGTIAHRQTEATIREVVYHPITTIYQGVEYKIVLDTIDNLGNKTLVMVCDTHAITLVKDKYDRIIYQSEVVLAEVYDA